MDRSLEPKMESEKQKYVRAGIYPQVNLVYTVYQHVQPSNLLFLPTSTCATSGEREPVGLRGANICLGS